MGVALIVVIGWALGIEMLRTTGIGVRPMRLDTAVGFLLVGGSLLAISRPAGTPWRRRAIGPVTGLLGVTTLVGARALVAPNPDVGRWLDSALPGGPERADPLWMSPTVIVSFLCIGTALLIIDRRPNARVAFGLLVVPLALAWLNVLDLLLNDGVGTLLGSTAQMAPSTALLMVLVSVGAMALLGPSGPLAVFLGPTSSSRLARRLLFAALVVPALVAWVRVQGEEHGLVAAGTGTSLMVLATFTLLAVAIWQTARVAGRTETARKAALDELDRFFEVSADLLATVDADGRLVRVNPAWTATLGYPADAMVGHRVIDFIHPDDAERTVTSMIDRFQQHGVVHGFQNRYRHVDGSYRWLEWNTAPSADGRLAYTSARDVTARRREEAIQASQRDRLRQRNQGLAVRVTHDPLTGLHNRAWFDRAFGAVITRRLRRSDGVSPTAAIMFDLDRFGQLNKQYGHQAGDAMLRQFGQLLRDRFREGDITARYGGEEFVAVLVDCTREDAARAADDVRAALEAVAIDHDGLLVRTTVSVGCAALEPNMSPTDLLARADLALSMAKRAGRNTVVVA